MPTSLQQIPPLSPPTAGSPHAGEERFPERRAPSDVQDRSDHSVNAGQDTNGVSAFVPERITRRADEITHDNVNEYRQPGP